MSRNERITGVMAAANGEHHLVIGEMAYHRSIVAKENHLNGKRKAAAYRQHNRSAASAINNHR